MHYGPCILTEREVDLGPDWKKHPRIFLRDSCIDEVTIRLPAGLVYVICDLPSFSGPEGDLFDPFTGDNFLIGEAIGVDKPVVG